MKMKLQHSLLVLSLVLVPRSPVWAIESAEPVPPSPPLPPPEHIADTVEGALAQAQAEVARQMSEVRRQVEQQLAGVGDLHQHALELARAASAVPAVPEAPPPPHASTGFRLGGGKPHSPGDTLVIHSSAPDAKAQANLEEDLAVMARVLDKAATDKLGDERRPRAMGIDVFLKSTSGGPRAFYLEDYGAVFLLNVPIPLLPPPEKAEPAKTKSETDASWEQARRELYGDVPFLDDILGKALRLEVHGETLPEYDAKKVEALKEALLGALKNARNIRGLRPDDTITVCVSGAGGGDGSRRHVVKVERGDEGDKVETVSEDEVVAVDGKDRSPVRGSLLTIRVKKADADAFAAGDVDLSAFQKKARTAVYPGGTSGPKTHFDLDVLRY
jgi:hypothetical protein